MTEEIKKDDNNNNEIEELKKELEASKIKREEYLNGWKRERADFLNYKKDEMERIEGLLCYASEENILKILPILDNFDIATRQNFLSENSGGQGKEMTEKIIQGFQNIQKQVEEFLKSQGIEEIKSIGELFNPNFHEAVGELEEASGEKEKGEEGEKREIKSGIIVEEVQKGYMLNGKVIRPARVKVSK